MGISALGQWCHGMVKSVRVVVCSRVRALFSVICRVVTCFRFLVDVVHGLAALIVLRSGTI